MFSALSVVIALSAVVAVLGGAKTGLWAMAGGLLAFGAYHVRNLQRLVDWARAPVDTPLPRAVGTWDMIFADLGRRSRVARGMRENLTSELERFHEASEAMPDGVMYLSGADAIEWFNLKAGQHFALDRSRDLGVPVTNLVRHPEFVACLHAPQDDGPLVLRPSRRPGLTLQLQVIPFGDGRRMVLSRDVSQLARLETMRSDFVANVSHELRTPLTVVGGFLETLIDGLDDFSREDVLHFLRLASEQSVRMQRLIEDLLTLSALETGAPAPTEERVDVGELMREVHRETRLLSAGRHTVTLALDGDSVLLGSREELRSAFSNLGSNAIRYTQGGGHVTLAWRADENGGEFSVTDDGIGIEAQHIPRLTERFYRVDRGRSRETGGTGLGLAIVKHILGRHQAELGVHSAPGKGSRFTARFPRSRVMPGSAAQS